MVVMGGNHADEFLRQLGDGRGLGLKYLSYSYQDKAGGIAEALGLAEHFVDNDSFIVILGDNIIEQTIAPYVKNFRQQERGARLHNEVIDCVRRHGAHQLASEVAR